MQTKKIIQIVVIVAAFGGSGFVLYNGFFSNPNAPQQKTWSGAIVGFNSAPGASAPKTDGPILPDGNTLDLTLISNGRFQFDAVQYATVTTSTEIGVPLTSLIHGAGGQSGTQ